MFIYLGSFKPRVCVGMDAFHASIGSPQTEGIVRLRIPSPTAKQSAGLFALIPTVKVGISASLISAFRLRRGFRSLRGATMGSAPRPSPLTR